jgi:hypothetical protein
MSSLVVHFIATAEPPDCAFRKKIKGTVGELWKPSLQEWQENDALAVLGSSFFPCLLKCCRPNDMRQLSRSEKHRDTLGDDLLQKILARLELTLAQATVCDPASAPRSCAMDVRSQLIAARSNLCRCSLYP